MPTASSTARRNIPPTRCRSSIRRRTRSPISRCRSPIRRCRSRLDRATPARSKPAAPSAYWGERGAWDTASEQPQLDVRREGPAVALQPACAAWTIPISARRVRIIPRPRCSRSIQSRAPGGDARSEDDEVLLHRYLLRHAPSAIRLRRRQYAVAVRLGPGGGLGEHQGLRRDRRRAEGARLVPVRARHQRQRQARRMGRAGQAGGRARICASIRARAVTR